MFSWAKHTSEFYYFIIFLGQKQKEQLPCLLYLIQIFALQFAVSFFGYGAI